MPERNAAGEPDAVADGAARMRAPVSQLQARSDIGVAAALVAAPVLILCLALAAAKIGRMIIEPPDTATTTGEVQRVYVEDAAAAKVRGALQALRYRPSPPQFGTTVHPAAVSRIGNDIGLGGGTLRFAPIADALSLDARRALHRTPPDFGDASSDIAADGDLPLRPVMPPLAVEVEGRAQPVPTPKRDSSLNGRGPGPVVVADDLRVRRSIRPVDAIGSLDFVNAGGRLALPPSQARTAVLASDALMRTRYLRRLADMALMRRLDAVGSGAQLRPSITALPFRVSASETRSGAPQFLERAGGRPVVMRHATERRLQLAALDLGASATAYSPTVLQGAVRPRPDADFNQMARALPRPSLRDREYSRVASFAPLRIDGDNVSQILRRRHRPFLSWGGLPALDAPGHASDDIGRCIAPSTAMGAGRARLQFEKPRSGMQRSVSGSAQQGSASEAGSHVAVGHAPLMGRAFGLALSRAALAQRGSLVIYSASYEKLAYPMGDIPSLYGACSDVIIRAYRALGFDLQQAIHEARVGTGDRNIDHRRTETLARYFKLKGAKLPITFYPENYQPGDIVTYHRPFSRVSRAHVAIVTHLMAPTGRPLILHNRGYSVQLEDALFVDKITGHFRFRPFDELPSPVMPTSTGFANASNAEAIAEGPVSQSRGDTSRGGSRVSRRASQPSLDPSISRARPPYALGRKPPSR